MSVFVIVVERRLKGFRLYVGSGFCITLLTSTVRLRLCSIRRLPGFLVPGKKP